MPVSGRGKGISGMLRNLGANNPELVRQVTYEETMSPMQRSSGPIPSTIVKMDLHMGSDLINTSN
jgi:hypothetical protein